MKECLHGAFNASVAVTRLTDHPENPATGFTADVHIECVECGAAFVFIGLPGGSHPKMPTVSFDGTEARLPIRPPEVAP